MAIIKCKMCGGDLLLTEGQSVAECEYCGSRQTVPAADNEKKLTLFSRANKLRAACEFDKAAGVYESIVGEFPDEAEAYWGLVLCKYGIEYVDDPGTGKKIPTCHRSSFDSVMDDSNFEQAMENADEEALRVYRAEAKQIETIRKGILEVSTNEKPYDIFICYKETDTNGDRTVDSLLAQDIYDALTAGGYRVFFSRITLEDKLGQAYEPYIFAALNSAKIMMAVGTCYEHYHAVWVKNEWSRYLKIIAQDKNKYLIPCYKGIDAYDIPKEFAHLQGQDMGKVGAIQDLLRGVEKLLPRQQPVAVVQERVVVGGSGGNKIAALLDRGNMALEDGDWAKADSFFEDVLNNDSKNAQAYLGKTLAQEKCRTIDAFIRKRKDATQNVLGQTLQLEPNKAHVDKMVQKCAIDGYVPQSSIRKLYDFDLSYHSVMVGRKQQYRSEEKYWAEHKLLSRAEKFAVGPVAENLKQEKQTLLAALADRVKKAEEAEAAAKKDVRTHYEAHLRQADAQAEKLYQEGFARRDKRYQELLENANASSNVNELKRTAKKFEELGDYKDSKKMVEHCLKRADEEQARIARKEQKRKNRIRIIAAITLAAIGAFTALWFFVIVPNQKYDDARALMNEGKYVEAFYAFEAMGDYKDSANLRHDCAVALAEQGEIEKAAITFGHLDDYPEARDRSMELWKQSGRIVSIEAGSGYTVALKADGTVVAVGWNDHGECDVSGWKNIVAISARNFHTVGLKADGTVLAVGRNDDGECDVSEWEDIIAISAGDWHTVGLKADGTVVAVGLNSLSQCNVSKWKDVVAINAGDLHTVGLKADGTVLAVGLNESGLYDVSGWNDVVAISTGDSHTVGLKADGTVLAVGLNENSQCDVSGWNDVVAISTGDAHTVGLKADGTVVAVGLNDDGQCEVSEWTDIVAISAGSSHTVGLKADGTVVAVGWNEYGQCDVSDWTNIMIP